MVNPHGLRLWKEGADCVWKQHGLWDLDSQGHVRLLEPHKFADANFGADFLLPFVREFERKIRSVLPSAVIFVEGVPEPLNIAKVIWVTVLALFLSTHY